MARGRCAIWCCRQWAPPRPGICSPLHQVSQHRRTRFGLATQRPPVALCALSHTHTPRQGIRADWPQQADKRTPDATQGHTGNSSDQRTACAVASTMRAFNPPPHARYPTPSPSLPSTRASERPVAGRAVAVMPSAHCSPNHSSARPPVPAFKPVRLQSQAGIHIMIRRPPPTPIPLPLSLLNERTASVLRTDKIHIIPVATCGPAVQPSIHPSTHPRPPCHVCICTRLHAHPFQRTGCVVDYGRDMGCRQRVAAAGEGSEDSQCAQPKEEKRRGEGVGLL